MSSVDVELFILKKIEHSFKHPVCDMIIFVFVFFKLDVVL